MSAILNAFFNPTRIKILMCLHKNPKNVTELISVCGISQSGVSQHLAILRKSGLVSARRNGKEIFYSLKDIRAGNVARELAEISQEI